MGKNYYEDNLSVDEKILMAVIRTAEIFKRTHTSIFRQYGISFPQYNVLRALAGSPDGCNKIVNISRMMLVANANITGIAQRLEKNGFIIKKSKPTDKRVTLLEITTAGIEILNAIETEKDRQLELMLRQLSFSEKQTLLACLRRLLKDNL